MVHYNSKYDDLNEAKKKKDGIAVLAFFLYMSNCKENSNWSPILNNLHKVAGSKDDEYKIDHELNLVDLLPSPKPKNFYFYRQLIQKRSTMIT